MSEGVARQPTARYYVSGESDDPVVAEVFGKIRANGGEPAMMHRVLAAAPNVFAATVNLAVTLRSATILPRDVGELTILRTAQIEGGHYEFAAHRVLGLQVGLTAEQVDSLDHWQEVDIYSDQQKAVLGYVDALGARTDVPDDVYEKLAAHFSPQEVIELTMTSGFYIAAARISSGLKMEIEH